MLTPANARAAAASAAGTLDPTDRASAGNMLNPENQRLADQSAAEDAQGGSILTPEQLGAPGSQLPSGEFRDAPTPGPAMSPGTEQAGSPLDYTRYAELGQSDVPLKSSDQQVAQVAPLAVERPLDQGMFDPTPLSQRPSAYGTLQGGVGGFEEPSPNANVSSQNLMGVADPFGSPPASLGPSGVLTGSENLPLGLPNIGPYQDPSSTSFGPATLGNTEDILVAPTKENPKGIFIEGNLDGRQYAEVGQSDVPLDAEQGNVPPSSTALTRSMLTPENQAVADAVAAGRVPPTSIASSGLMLTPQNAAAAAASAGTGWAPPDTSQGNRMSFAQAQARYGWTLDQYNQAYGLGPYHYAPGQDPTYQNPLSVPGVPNYFDPNYVAPPPGAAGPAAYTQYLRGGPGSTDTGAILLGVGATPGGGATAATPSAAKSDSGFDPNAANLSSALGGGGPNTTGSMDPIGGLDYTVGPDKPDIGQDAGAPSSGTGQMFGPFAGGAGPGSITPSGGFDYLAGPGRIDPIGGLDYSTTGAIPSEEGDPNATRTFGDGTGPMYGPFAGEAGPGTIAPSGGLDFLAGPGRIDPIGGLDYTTTGTPGITSDDTAAPWNLEPIVPFRSSQRGPSADEAAPSEWNLEPIVPFRSPLFAASPITPLPGGVDYTTPPAPRAPQVDYEAGAQLSGEMAATPPQYEPYAPQQPLAPGETSPQVVRAPSALGGPGPAAPGTGPGTPGTTPSAPETPGVPSDTGAPSAPRSAPLDGGGSALAGLTDKTPQRGGFERGPPSNLPPPPQLVNAMLSNASPVVQQAAGALNPAQQMQVSQYTFGLINQYRQMLENQGGIADPNSAEWQQQILPQIRAQTQQYVLQLTRSANA